MQRVILASLLSAIGLAAVLAILAAGWFWLGGFDASAASHRSDLALRPFRVALERQVEMGAARAPAPPPATRRRIVIGYRQYDADCAVCHGTPTASRAPWARSMNPEPPDLTVRTQWSPRQLFWLICHGVKMTGMPAFGVQRTDDQIWGLALFVSALPDISPQDFERLRATYGPAPKPFSLTPNAACLSAK